MKQIIDFNQERNKFVEQYIRPEIRDPRIVTAFLEVPREEFVLPEDKNLAYLDIPLPIGEDQTTSQPSLVAKMIENLQLKGKEKVLEIGTGWGYQSAIISRLVKQVYTVERIKSLAEKAKEILARLNYLNIKVIIGDGSKGLPEEQPFDGIIVSAAARTVPPDLVDQLKPERRIVIPVWETSVNQNLLVGVKKDNQVFFENLGEVTFVPFV